MFHLVEEIEKNNEKERKRKIQEMNRIDLNNNFNCLLLLLLLWKENFENPKVDR